MAYETQAEWTRNGKKVDRMLAKEGVGRAHMTLDTLVSEFQEFLFVYAYKMSHMRVREPGAEEAGKNSQRLNDISVW